MNYSRNEYGKTPFDYNFDMKRNPVLVRFRSGAEEADRVFQSLLQEGAFQAIRTVERNSAANEQLTEEDARRCAETIRAESGRDILIVIDHPDLNPADFADIRNDIAENPDRILALDIRCPLPRDHSVIQKYLTLLIEKSSLPLASVWYIPASAAGRLRDEPDPARSFPLRWLLGCRLAQIPVQLRSRRVGWIGTYRSQKFSLIALIWYYLNRLVRYSTASFSSVLLDYAVFSLVLIPGGAPLAALIIGRVCSTIFNFMMLRRFVYQDQAGTLWPTVVRYSFLTLFSTAVAFFTIEFIRARVRLPVLFIKMVVEICLFFFNFTMSRAWVFVGKRKRANG